MHFINACLLCTMLDFFTHKHTRELPKLPEEEQKMYENQNDTLENLKRKNMKMELSPSVVSLVHFGCIIEFYWFQTKFINSNQVHPRWFDWTWCKETSIKFFCCLAIKFRSCSLHFAIKTWVVLNLFDSFQNGRKTIQLNRKKEKKCYRILYSPICQEQCLLFQYFEYLLHPTTKKMSHIRYI